MCVCGTVDNWRGITVSSSESTFDLVMFTVSLEESALAAGRDFSFFFFSIAAQNLQPLLSVALGVVNHHNGHGHTDARLFLVLNVCTDVESRHTNCTVCGQSE